MTFRYIKRAVTAHVITLQALFDMLLDDLQSSDEALPDVFKQEIIFSNFWWEPWNGSLDGYH